MKRLVPLLLVLFVATSTFAGWNSGGPIGGAVAAVVVAPSDPNVIWAGNSGGVFRSTDGGATWSDVSGPVVDVDYLAVHPTDPNRAWALTGTWPVTRFYRTDDGGATWRDLTDGLDALRPGGLAVDPRNPDTLYVSSGCMQLFDTIGAPQGFGPGVMKSTDGGVTWKASYGGASAYGGCAEEMAVDPFSPWRVFVAGQLAFVESYDSGATWQQSDGPRPTRAVVFDARYPFTHYGLGSGFAPDVLVSQDGGFTWAKAGTPPSVARAISMDPERSRIFLGTFAGVWRSGNGGTVWAKTSLTAAVNALDFGGVPAALFAATNEGLYRMLNRGLGESRLLDLHDRAADVMSIAVDPSSPDVVYAGVQSPVNVADVVHVRSRVFRSTNGGASWERLPGDDDADKAGHLAVGADGTLYAGSRLGPLYRRTREATAWTIVHDGGVDSVAADPKTAGIVFLSTSNQTLRSRDGGATWLVVLNHSSRFLLIDPADPRWIFTGTDRSSDGGDTWTPLPDFSSGFFSIDTVVLAPSNGAVMYRIGNRTGRAELQRSDDRGTTWQTLQLPLNAPATVAVDPRDANSVWAVATDGPLYHSLDGGATWQAVDGPFPTGVAARLLVFDPTGRVLHAAYPNHGVWELTAP